MALPYRTITEAVLAAPPQRPFLTLWRDEDAVETVTFGELITRARIRAAEFASQGLRSGDTVVLIMPQDVPLTVSFVAAMLVGAVPSILAYPNFKVDPQKYRSGLAGVAKNLNARLIVVDEDFPDELLSLTPGAKILKGTARAPAADFLLADGSPGQIAFIQHSAGTTGLQKGVALSHAIVLRQLDLLTGALGLTENDRIYSWLPLYHDMGLIACLVLPLVYHVPVVMQTPTDWVLRPGSMLSLIGRYRCTLAWTPNFALQFLARRVPERDRAGLELASLRALINCSEPVRPQSIDAFVAAYARHGLRAEALQTSYAMAENVFAVTQSAVGRGAPARIWVDARRLSEEHAAYPLAEGAKDGLCLVSSGRCLPGNEVRIVSASFEDLPDGRVGEILVRGNCLFGGYHNRPDLTEKAFRDGWYRSGDLGLRLDGELFVIGRKNDLIIVAGKNIYPQDLEEIACGDSRIHDGRAVAFGIFNKDLGTEEIFIVAEVEDEAQMPNALSIEQSVRNAVAVELGVAVRAVYIRPPKWIVKSTAGKPARSTTREKLLAEQPELQRG